MASGWAEKLWPGLRHWPGLRDWGGRGWQGGLQGGWLWRLGWVGCLAWAELGWLGCSCATSSTSTQITTRIERGAHISLINEFRTSKCCCRQCGAILSCIFKRRNKRVILKKAQKIHGVLKCNNRDGNRGHGFVHRDKNGAVNIMSSYEAFANEEKNERPIQFRPVRGNRYS